MKGSREESDSAAEASVESAAEAASELASTAEREESVSRLRSWPSARLHVGRRASGPRIYAWLREPGMTRDSGVGRWRGSRDMEPELSVAKSPLSRAGGRVRGGAGLGNCLGVSAGRGPLLESAVERSRGRAWLHAGGGGLEHLHRAGMMTEAAGRRPRAGASGAEADGRRGRVWGSGPTATRSRMSWTQADVIGLQKQGAKGGDVAIAELGGSRDGLGARRKPGAFEGVEPELGWERRRIGSRSSALLLECGELAEERIRCP